MSVKHSNNPSPSSNGLSDTRSSTSVTILKAISKFKRMLSGFRFKKKFKIQYSGKVIFERRMGIK